MTNEEKNKIEEEDIIEQMEEEIEEIENSDGEIDEEKLKEESTGIVEEIDENSALAKVMADYENFKKRTERDKTEMIFFLKKDILQVLLPRLDDLERIIEKTPIELKDNTLFQGVVSMQAKLIADLEKQGVKPFNSLGKEVDPNKHDVMTTVPGKDAGIIFDEFEKGYMLNDKVLRHAKVIVGA